jgi:formylglycine-generating enzyme required for sulfatase activity
VLSFLGVAGLAAPDPRHDQESADINTHRTYTETIPGSGVSFTMIAIPGGTFRQGSPEGEKGRDADEGPPHPVRIRPFWMGRCEVTWDEFDLFHKGGPASDRENEAARARDVDAVTRPTPPYVDETWGFGGGRHPVVGIAHHAAMEYCHWLSRRTGKVYRLPTEAEWEYACRAGTTTAYFFGDDPARLGEFAWYDQNADEETWPVGLTKANPWGLHDVYGNVAEWCLDHYRTDDYRTFPLDQITLGPVRPPTAARYGHVVRGGSWADGPARCRSAARRGSDKSWNRRDPSLPQSIWWLSDADFVGFRVVRAVAEQPELRGLRSKVTKQSE